ncbi:MAG: VanZ family protein [Eubacterium sp.]|nr:VanZ family protein [Eubacterium sp.]
MKRNFFTVLVVLWMVLIFFFSAQPADTSTEISHSVGRTIGVWFVPGFEEWTSERQESFAEAVDYPVRKGAHASEYAILALLFIGMLHSYGVKEKKWALLMTTAYAATDEFHQLFVPGRSGQISDVMLDAAGALAGYLFFLFCRAICRRIKGKSPDT